VRNPDLNSHLEPEEGFTATGELPQNKGLRVTAMGKPLRNKVSRMLPIYMYIHTHTTNPIYIHISTHTYVYTYMGVYVLLQRGSRCEMRFHDSPDASRQFNCPQLPRPRLLDTLLQHRDMEGGGGGGADNFFFFRLLTRP